MHCHRIVKEHLMKSSKKSVRTPLHLLHELSNSLITNLEQACISAQIEAEKALLKLDKRTKKILEKHLKAKEKLKCAVQANKTKSIKKAQNAIVELEASHIKLLQYQEDLQAYINQLKQDTTKSLDLAKPIKNVIVKTAALIDKNIVAPTSTTRKITTARKVATQKTPSPKQENIATKTTVKATTTRKTPVKPIASQNSSTTKSSASTRQPRATRQPRTIRPKS